MMHSINFKEATHILGVAQGYLPLAVVRTEEKGVVINNSYWKPTEDEIELLKTGHMLHIGILGAQPPLMVAISNIPIEELPYRKAGLNMDQVKNMVALSYKQEPEKLKCIVCDGTGFKDGAAGGDEECRFCHGGYLDAAN